MAEPTQQPKPNPDSYEPPAAEEMPARDGTVETAGGAITGGDTGTF
jgi:hypothetical protein